MKAKEILKGAKFGARFKTYDGRLAIYHYHDDKFHYLIVENDDVPIVCHSNGLIVGIRENNKHYTDDIVSKYIEEANEVYLAEHVDEWTKFVKDTDPLLKVVANECAKIGYRKAIQDVQQ